MLLSSRLISIQDNIEETSPKCKHLLLLEPPKEIRDVCMEPAIVMHGNDLQETAHSAVTSEEQEEYFWALDACT